MDSAKPQFRGLKGLKKRRRIQVIGLAFAALAAALALVFFAVPKESFQFFRAPSELAEKPVDEGEVFRLGGLVKEGSIGAVEGTHFDFVITDGGAEVPVRYLGDNPRPDLFAEGQGTVATGKMVGGTFEATELLAKHDENYMPKEVVDALKDQGVYVDPASQTGG